MRNKITFKLEEQGLNYPLLHVYCGDKPIGSYAESSANGNYLVYSLINIEGVRSTLGIRKVNYIFNDGSKVCDGYRYDLDQHYLVYNQRVTDKDMIDCAEKIVEHLNSKTREENLKTDKIGETV